MANIVDETQLQEENELQLNHDPSKFKNDPSEGSVNDKNYYGIIEETYGKRFFRMGNGQLVQGDITLKIGETMGIAGFGPYDGIWELMSVTQNVDKNTFKTSFGCRRLTNSASGKLQKGEKIVVDYIKRNDGIEPSYEVTQVTEEI